MIVFPAPSMAAKKKIEMPLSAPSSPRKWDQVQAPNTSIPPIRYKTLKNNESRLFDDWMKVTLFKMLSNTGMCMTFVVNHDMLRDTKDQ